MSHVHTFIDLDEVQRVTQIPEDCDQCGRAIRQGREAASAISRIHDYLPGADTTLMNLIRLAPRSQAERAQWWKGLAEGAAETGRSYQQAADAERESR